MNMSQGKSIRDVKNIILFTNSKMKPSLRIHIKEKISVESFFKNIKEKSHFIQFENDKMEVLTEKDILQNQEKYLFDEENQKQKDEKSEKGEKDEKENIYYSSSAFQNSPKASELPDPDPFFFT